MSREWSDEMSDEYSSKRVYHGEHVYKPVRPVRMDKKEPVRMDKKEPVRMDKKEPVRLDRQVSSHTDHELVAHLDDELSVHVNKKMIQHKKMLAYALCESFLENMSTLLP